MKSGDLLLPHFSSSFLERKNIRKRSITERKQLTFLSAFCAALVALPSTTLGVVALMTPTATVCLMSRTANLDRVGLKETFKE